MTTKDDPTPYGVMSPFPRELWYVPVACGHPWQKAPRIDQKTTTCQVCKRRVRITWAK